MKLHPWPELQAELAPLTTEERDGLARSIAAFGVQSPVLALPDGRIIDGHHRYAIAGDAAPVKVITDLDDASAYALGISANTDRRQLSGERAAQLRTHWREHREAAKRAMIAMAEQGKTQREIAAATGYSQPRVSEIITASASKISESDIFDAGRRKPKGHIPPEDRAVIQARADDGESYESIARDYEVTGGAIRLFLKRDPRTGPNPRRRFTDAEEAQIERRYAAGETHTTLGAAYGCSPSLIGDIVRRVRAQRDGTPASTTTDRAIAPVPTNVVAFPPTPKRDAPPKKKHEPFVIQRAAVSLLEEARRFHDRINDLESRFGDDLIPALTGSAEGELIDTQCTALADRLVRLAAAIRERNHQHHDSTGS